MFVGMLRACSHENYDSLLSSFHSKKVAAIPTVSVKILASIYFEIGFEVSACFSTMVRDLKVVFHTKQISSIPNKIGLIFNFFYFFSLVI